MVWSWEFINEVIVEILVLIDDIQVICYGFKVYYVCFCGEVYCCIRDQYVYVFGRGIVVDWYGDIVVFIKVIIVD